MGFERPQRIERSKSKGSSREVPPTSPQVEKPIDLETASEDELVVYRGRIYLKMLAARRTDPDWAKELEEHLERIDVILMKKFRRAFA